MNPAPARIQGSHFTSRLPYFSDLQRRRRKNGAPENYGKEFAVTWHGNDFSIHQTASQQWAVRFGAGTYRREAERSEKGRRELEKGESISHASREYCRDNPAFFRPYWAPDIELRCAGLLPSLDAAKAWVARECAKQSQHDKPGSLVTLAEARTAREQKKREAEAALVGQRRHALIAKVMDLTEDACAALLALIEHRTTPAPNPNGAA